MTQTYFKKQCDFKVDYAPATIKKWKSTRTGLQVTLIDQASPIVNGYFAVATEIMNDTGCPHTLEHLIFMGSKKYPYKGLLDILGNLAFSSTNAWTATDQTVYTLTSAGWEGFKMLLPVYLDHLFNATITDSACYTEVYHVDGKGKEKGVVYSEMQGIENQSWFISNLATQRALYKNSGYKSETGGLTKNLRDLNAETIRKYHADNYRPENLCIIVTGSVNEKELLDMMDIFDSELQDLPEIPNKRPFVDTPRDLPLSENITQTVSFPDKDETSGSVNINWIGPDSRDQVLDQAIDILGQYLTSSSVSLFGQHFTEVDDPWCTSADFYTESYILTGMVLGFSNVAKDKLQLFPPKILELMKSHCDASKMDLVRLKDLVEQSMWKFIHNAEKSPENMAYISIFEFEYGENSGEDLENFTKTLNEFKTLLEWDIDQWVSVFQKYYVDNKCCITIAEPSKALYKQNKAENSKVLKDRKASLGEAGLKKLEDKLNEAQKNNNVAIPDDILAAFGRPDPSKINFIKTESIASGINKDVAVSDSKTALAIYADTPKDFPMYVHFENHESNFVNIHLLFSSFEIEEKYLPLLKVFETITTLPIEEEDGTVTPYEDVVKQFKRDVITSHFGNSFNGRFADFMTFSMAVKSENYQIAIDWYIKMLFQTRFTKERVVVALNKLINSLPELKRSGSYMLSYLYNKHTFTERSFLKTSEVIYNENYFKEVMKTIEEGDFSMIETQLNNIRDQLFQKSNTRILVFGDVTKLESPVSSWQKLVDHSKGGEKLTELPYPHKVLSENGTNGSKKAFVISTPGSDSSYMNLVTKTPIFDFESEDAFKIMLAAEYLQCVEGPFWRGIRGAGLAYGANCYSKATIGELCFSIYRGADVENSYLVAKKIVADLANKEVAIEDTLRQGSVSSIVNSITESQSYYSVAATAQFYDNVLLKRGPEYNNKLMKALSAITNDDLVEIFQKYFINLFDSEKSLCYISCNPAKVEGVESFLSNLDYSVDIENVQTDSSNNNSNANGKDLTDESENDDDSEEFTDESENSDDSSDEDDSDEDSESDSDSD